MKWQTDIYIIQNEQTHEHFEIINLDMGTDLYYKICCNMIVLITEKLQLSRVDV